MNPLKEIETACAELAGYRAQLRKRHEARELAIRSIDQDMAPEMRRLQERCSATRAAIAAQIETRRQSFRAPKTREFHGITVGFEKTRDSLQYPPDEILIPRIESMLPKAQAETVLQKATTILRTPLKALGLKVLQKLGISKVNGADKVVIRAADDDIETLVQKSLGEIVPETK